jgi:glycosyltransferase involved in cell wall biosynthesis
MLRVRSVRRLARTLRPDVIIERYYNFGGEGILAARSVGALSVLEVNAPVVDYPGSAKQRLDRLLLFEPMRRWRDWQCASADLIITPSPRIIPAHVPASRVLQIEWGADVTRFRPGVRGDVPFTRTDSSDVIAIFAGAFRVWHGAVHLVDAIRQLRAKDIRRVKAVFTGDGPELERVKRAAAGVEGITFTGALDHERMPACLSAADIGVAPFDVLAHPALLQDFYWSPLKIFEYMASGLPVVTPRIARLEHIVRDEREGILYDAANAGSLTHALEQLLDPDLRSRLGAGARSRVVSHFSWEEHCRKLEHAIQAMRRDTAGAVVPCAS